MSKKVSLWRRGESEKGQDHHKVLDVWFTDYWIVIVFEDGGRLGYRAHLFDCYSITEEPE